ncbi:Putative membrane protein [Minicystis rosea]|nr:Putative membrane protein [Minicystis rosea]
MISVALTSLSIARFLDPLFIFLVTMAVLLRASFRSAPKARGWTRRARLGLWIAWAFAWIFSLPFTASLLNFWCETRGPDLQRALAGHDPDKSALVVLAAGVRTYDATVPLRERMDGTTTHRVLTAARLWNEHRFGLVIVSGAPAALPHCMKDLLVTMGVPADRIVTETESLNTRENARFSAEILRARGAETVVVVTSATHLRRAVREMARAGITAIPAPAELRGLPRSGLDALLPSVGGLAATHVVLHEVLGLLRG